MPWPRQASAEWGAAVDGRGGEGEWGGEAVDGRGDEAKWVARRISGCARGEMAVVVRKSGRCDT